MSETKTELLRRPTSPTEIEVYDAVRKLRRARIQRSTANAVVAIGVLAVALCLPLMRVVVGDYSLGAQLALTTESCDQPQVSSDIHNYCEQAKHGQMSPAVSVSKALVGSPISAPVGAVGAVNPASPAPTAPLHAFPVPGQPGVITIPLPDGTTGRLVLPPSKSAVPQDNPTATVLADPPIKSQPPTATVVPPPPGSTAGPTTVVPIEPPPAQTTSSAAPPPVTTTAEAPSSQAPAPAPASDTPPSTTTTAPPPSEDTTATPAPTQTATQTPQDPTTTTADPVVPTTDPPQPTVTTTTVEPTPSTETSSPSLVGQVVDSLFSSIAGVI